MCGRYVLVQQVEVLEKRFQVKVPPGYVHHTGVNIGPGSLAPVITDAAPGELQNFQFGLTPFWAKKRMYLFNARAEGDRNAENDPAYTGALEIVRKPAFRKPIRSQRCLVPFDAFIEGTVAEKLKRPFLVQPTDREPPYAFAGIWDSWVDQATGEVVNGFSLITQVANSTLQRLPHHRSPVVLAREHERAWIDPGLPLADVLSLLKPYPGDAMNAWPIDPAIRDPRAHDPALIKPLGDAVRSEQEFIFRADLVLQGMQPR